MAKKQVAQARAATLFTIGHSTRPIDEFVEMLKAYDVEQLVDVRLVAKSRHNPQFNQDALEASLRDVSIDYVHARDLGGLRHAKKDSINTGWKNASFRGYADYMLTDRFSDALASLKTTSLTKITAIMCAEAVPWRCHRSLIADALVTQDRDVRHIMSKTVANRHELTPFAKVTKGRLVYPPK